MDEAEAYFESSAVRTARPVGLPESVRDAREAALGLAGFGLAYPVVMGLIAGDEAARSAALQFGCSWVLGLAVLGLGRGPRVRRVAIVSVMLQSVAVLRMHVEAVPDLARLVVVLFTLGASATILYQLSHPEAKAWFDIRVADAEW
ncbi:hypothetical protein [Nocardia vinacea]|uniref:hypothetical protein n=1 Tax=Nocardia vinacea TaxID=96468 RepID=UPI000311A8E6|nr:hypothetical protein [Nocardia vinacea]